MITEIKHEITLNRGIDRQGHDGLLVTCSCDEVIWTGPFPVKWDEISRVLVEHLRPQTEQMIKDVMKQFSVRDMLKAVRMMGKK